MMSSAAPRAKSGLAERVAEHLSGAAAQSTITFETVLQDEVSLIKKAKGLPENAPADSLVGLALSGGGIRSATFGLGVLQAFRSLGVFDQIDYVSSVSGGGYINGWLQGLAARDATAQALPADPAADRVERHEARQVRFLRAYSNYLTPKLGLFSGDTWAAVGTSVRNLVLNLSVLSLSLIPLLYIPWLVTLGFWRIVPDNGDPLWPLFAAAALLTTTVTISTMNMSQPLKDGTWDKPVGTQAPTWKVLLLVVLPALLAVGVLSPLVWTWAVRGDFDGERRVLNFSLIGGLFYSIVWFSGALAGFGVGRVRPPDRNGRPAGTDWRLAVRALLVLVVSAFFAGVMGSLVAAVSNQTIARWMSGAQTSDHMWLAWLLVFPACVLSLLLSITVHIGLSGRWLSEETREWWGRVSGVQLLITLLLIIVSVLSLAGPHLWSWSAAPDLLKEYSQQINWLLGLAWAAITGGGIMAGRSSRTASGGASMLERLGRIAPVVFIIGYFVVLATFLHQQVPHPNPFGPSIEFNQLQVFSFDDVERTLRTLVEETKQPLRGVGPQRLTPMPWYEWPLLFVAVLVGGLAVALSRRIDLNEFSLHALYRNRLVRCYLGASNPKRAAHPFTGFDPRDDVPLAQVARPTPDAVRRPYPIFNVAMNLVGGKNLAWQQRKAASFVFTPEYCGFEYRVDEDNEQERQRAANGNGNGHLPPRLSAYAKTRDHAEDCRSLTLGLAIATSGAAASPNMGYHSSPTLAFLMTVFNVRLGWWLRNPRWPSIWSNASPRLSLKELMSELFGMTTDERNWVYLSDGGHFENLGIYELVRRRCRFIVACDAGQDANVTFEDLGNAIEKCRADFGIDIEINLEGLRPQGDQRYSAAHCAIGTIRYDQQRPHDPPGTLLYIKSTLTGDEPADVLRYAAAHPVFPHESTSDQFFDESQFESYRALGYHIACRVLTAAAEQHEMAAMPAVELFTHLRQHWTVSAPAPPDAIRKYSGLLTDIWTTVRTNPKLAFLDQQMFPAWASMLMRGDVQGAAHEGAVSPPLVGGHNWLPPNPEARRAGFYVCNQMLQLMEDAYLEFRLDEHYDHIDNRGWMNLFQHWAWSGMLCATWGITGSTYDPRFQRFCRRRLGLELGLPYVIDHAFMLPRPSEWRREDFDRAAHRRDWEQGPLGLNFFEVQLVDRFLSQQRNDTELRLMPVRVVVQSPKRDKDNLDFGVGYIIAKVDYEAKRCALHHMRVQNHVRKMGIAHQALKMLHVEWGLDLAVVAPPESAVSGNVALDEALPSPSGAARLRRYVNSLH